MRLNRREFLSLAAVTAVGSLQDKYLSAFQSSADQLYKTAIVVDGCGGPGGFSVDPQVPLTSRMIADAKNSGITCVNLTVGPVGNRPNSEALEGIFRDLGYWENEFEQHPDVFLKVKQYEDVHTAKSSDKVGIIFGLQDGVAFENDLTRLLLLYRFGVRIIQPTYNLRNLLGDGCLEPDNAGLSKIGKDAIARMNELGILVDLSHCCRKTTMEAITISSKPVAFTHTGCAAIHDHPRNKTDEQLRALANKGGVAGIYFMPYLRPSGQQTSEDVIRHLDHAIQVAGEDHVGIGTDGSISPLEFTPEYLKAHQEDIEARRKAGIGAPGETMDVHLYVPQLNTARRFETLADILLQKGYSQAQVEKVIGGNFARLFKEVW